MSAGNKKSTKPKRVHKKGAAPDSPLPGWKGIVPLIYGFAGGAAFFYLHQILSFIPEMSSGFIAMMTVIAGALALWGTSSFFQKHIQIIAYFASGLVLLHIVANVLVTYSWVSQSAVMSFIAGTITIPIAIIWFFILKYQAEPEPAVSVNESFHFLEVFKPVSAKIAGVLILAIGAFLIFYRLGYFDIWEDENLVINAAVGVTEKGYSYFADGYSRAQLHTMLIAGLFELFGPSEFIGRLPSAIFGVLFIALCFYVFSRWYGLVWLALLLPLICLMNDRFLLLFRYMRMYALLIPVFLAGVYIFHMTIDRFQQPLSLMQDKAEKRKTYGLVLLSLLCILLLAHLHKLSMIVLPVFGLYIIYLGLVYRTKVQMRFLSVIAVGVVVMLFLTFIVQWEPLKMFRQVADKILAPHTPLTAYFEYVFNNGLPRNSTILFLIVGLGLFFSNVSRRLKSLLVINYLLIIIAVISMVYLIGNSGRDYRYIAHIVPFVVCSILLVTYYGGKVFGKQLYPWSMLTILLISGIHFHQDYQRDYDRHPWAPRYSIVYQTLKSNYKPGDALIVQNVKTYYLDPEMLAGDNFLKVSKKGDYTLDQFKADVRSKGHGWVMWEWHKSHHWREEIRQYIYKKFKPYHNANMDDYGVELFYFDESMIGQGQK